MWLSTIWRPRNRFTLDELRSLTDQLQKFQVVNEVNKDLVIEALRSVAELITYGDQHDPLFFEFFMEKQIMGEFARVLRISTAPKVPLQLLQTMSIMIQNLRSEKAIYYLFSNEHINYLITYSFDFSNDELLSYYISFLRAISSKLNKKTISLLVKTQNDKVVSFPLYVQAIRFAFHEESMIRTAVRALTLNIYHVGDDGVNEFVSLSPQSDYFSKIVEYFSKQCLDLDVMTSPTARKQDISDSSSHILTAVEEIEDNLYYFSDVVSAGIPDLARLITDNILRLLVFPLLLPSLKKQNPGAQIDIATSLYLLCCILRIFKTKDFASTIAVSLFCPFEVFCTTSEVILNGHAPSPTVSEESQQHNIVPFDTHAETKYLGNLHSCSLSPPPQDSSSQSDICCSDVTSRELLLSYIAQGDELQVLGSLSLLATLLQTKELDESMLDGLGILPQRKQHKMLLLQALVGEDLGEEQLFSSNSMKDDMKTEFDRYMLKLKDLYGMPFNRTEPEANPILHKYLVLDALVRLFCRADVSAETLWLGGWLLRQLLPHGEEDFTSAHLKSLQESHNSSLSKLFKEVKGSWSDFLITVLKEEWRNCRRAIEAPSPPKDAKSVLFPSKRSSSEGESSFIAAERMFEMIKVFALQSELLLFSSGGSIPDLPPLDAPLDSPSYTRAKSSVFDIAVPKPGSEVSTTNAISCKIAFERGKERHFFFLALSSGTSGWLLLVEELPLKHQSGVVRVTAPLAGSDPKIDGKYPKWLHLRIRPSTLPFLDAIKFEILSKGKTKMVDGRWTLAFKDEQACKAAESMILEEISLLQSEVETRLKSLLKLDKHTFDLQPCSTSTEAG